MVTASVVLFNTSKIQLETIIDSFSPSKNRRLYLINNGEEKDYYKSFLNHEHVSYLMNDKNSGYGAAHNIGIKTAILEKSDYHIVLNPDLKFNSEIIDELVEYADTHSDVVYMLPKVLYPDGSLQYLCKLLPTPVDLLIRRFLPNIGVFKRMNDRYVLKDSGYNHVMNPPCLSGCFMFMRTKVLADNHLFFDEEFFMYCEDFDLMRRLHRIGKTIFYPNVTIIHDHEKSSYKSRRMLLQHIKSACKYFNKYGWWVDKERDKMNEEIVKSECC